MLSVSQKGYYYTDFITGKLVSTISAPDEGINSEIFSERELEIIKLLCTELAYKQIALELNTTVKNIDFHCGSIFKKMNVKTRIGAALYAIRHNMIELV